MYVLFLNAIKLLLLWTTRKWWEITEYLLYSWQKKIPLFALEIIEYFR